MAEKKSKLVEIKTKPTTASVEDFINAVPDEQKRKDSYELIGLMEQVSGFKAKMWGPSIIGFGSYHYKYASGHEGDAPLLGFSPRKAAISLYVSTGESGQDDLLKDLGKFTMGKACIYVKKLSDINQDSLVKLMKNTMMLTTEKYGA